MNSFKKVQLKELQERLDDMDNHQRQNGQPVTLEQAGMSRTNSESQNQLYDNSGALQNDFQVKTEAVLLDKCKGIEYNIK